MNLWIESPNNTLSFKSPLTDPVSSLSSLPFKVIVMTRSDFVRKS